MKNVMRKLLLVLLPVMFIITVSCELQVPTEADLPSWFVDLNIPLVKITRTGSDLISEDTTLVIEPYGDAGDSIFVYKKSFDLDTVAVGNQLNIEDISRSFTQTVDDIVIDGLDMEKEIGFDGVSIDDMSKSINSEIGQIELENTEPRASETFSFRNIMPADLVQSMEDAITANGGTATFNGIPARDLEPAENAYTFDSFQYVVLTSGALDLTVVNNMFIALGSPITVSLRYTDNEEFAQTIFTDPIPPNDSATRQIDLSGDSLASNIIIRVSGHSSGSSDQINLQSSDLDRGFHVVIQSHDMVATRAEAQIPSQTIDHTDSLTLAESDNKIESGELKTGTLSLDFENNMSIGSTVDIRIPSLLDADGTVYERTSIQLPARGTAHRDFSLAGTTLQMDMQKQYIEYEYSVNTTDSGTDYKEVDESDSVNVQFDMQDLTLAGITGILEQKKTIEDGDIPVETDNEITSAVIDQGSIIIDVDNQVGGHPHLNLVFHQIFTSKGSDDTLRKDIDLAEGINERVVIPLNGAEIRMPRNDQTIYYTTTTQTGGQYASYSLEDSVQVNIRMSAVTLSEATGYFTEDAMVKSDSIVLNEDTKIQEAQIDGGKLNFAIRNHIGVEGTVRLLLDEFTLNGHPLDTTLTIPGSDEPILNSIPLQGYKINMDLNEQMLHYTSRTRLAQSELMTLSFGDSIGINVNIRDLSFSEVSGNIEPVQVEIDPVEQEVSGLPEGISGISFRGADMTLDFNTNIGIPVFLDLRLVAYNSDGDSAVAMVSGWNITDSSSIHIPNAAELIDIFPERIVATGNATAGSPGEIGTIRSDQYVAGTFHLRIPMEFELGEDAVYQPKPELVEPQDGTQDLESVVVYTLVDNHFEIGANVQVYGAKDTLAFENLTAKSSPEEATALTSLSIAPGTAVIDSMVLAKDKIDLFQDSLYVLPKIRLLSTTSGTGNPQASRFLSTDSIEVTLYAKIKYLNSFNKNEENN